MGREEGDDSMCVGGRDSREEGGGVEGAGVEEVWGFYGVRDISNRRYRYKDWSENRDL
jgi:hypothetical protein